jgi:hypothetical protein
MFVAGLEPAPSPPPPDPSSSSDPAEPSSSKPPTSTSSAPKDEFEELTTRLRAALTAKGKTNVWEPAAEYGRAGTGAAEKKKTFRIVLADKVRLCLSRFPGGQAAEQGSALTSFPLPNAGVHRTSAYRQRRSLLQGALHLRWEVRDRR